jgi:hypothetical protein
MPVSIKIWLTVFLSIITIMAPAETIPCANFKWIGQGDLQRGAMALPIEISHNKLLFQLDTGYPYSIIYGSKAIEIGEMKTLKNKRIDLDIKIGEIYLPNVEFTLKPNHVIEEISGTIGLNALLNKIIAIDYVRHQICMLTTDEQLSVMTNNITWIPAKITDIGFFITANFIGSSNTFFAFDTGSSIAPVLVKHLIDWQWATGLPGINSASKHIEAYAWGKPIDIFSAPLKYPLQIGSILINDIDALYVPQQDVPSAPFAVLGNAIFWKHIIVLDLRATPRFGLANFQQIIN